MVLAGGIEKIAQSKSKTFLAFCFCFLGGVAVFSLVASSDSAIFIIVCFFFLFIFLSSYFWKDESKRFILLSCILFLVGGLRLLVYTPSVNDPGHIVSHIGQDVKLEFVIKDEPGIKSEYAEYVIKNPEHAGKILVRLPFYSKYSYGDKLAVACKLKAPEDANNFAYSKYLAVRGIWAICENEKIISVKGKEKSVLGRIFSFKKIVVSRVNELWPEPYASLAGGLLYGNRSGLADDLTQAFNRTGISHIIAVSGYNISIIAAALMILLIYIGLYRKQAFWVSVFAIIIFVIFTGASSSAVRAGIMGCVVLLGQYLGRPSRAAPALFLAAVLMVLYNPLVLFWDVGFQLSFAATAGILYLAPIVSERIAAISAINKLLPNKNTAPGVFSTTLSAIISTLPLILLNFGRLSVVALPVNILVLWLIPYIMLFSFLAIVSSVLFFPLGLVVAWFVQLGLRYIIWITEYFGNFSWSSIDWELSWWGMAAAYLLLVWYIIKKYRLKYGQKN